MTRRFALCLRALPLASLAFVHVGHAEGPAAPAHVEARGSARERRVDQALEANQEQPLRWVAERGKPSLRVSRGLMMREVEKAAALLMPSDHRFRLKSIAVKLLPIQNVVELQALGKASVPFVRDKRVVVTAEVRPEIDGENVRLVYVGMHRSVSQCSAEGPVCFMLKRAIDAHIADGRRIQEVLDDGMNAALRPVFRELAGLACATGPILPTGVRTGPEFLEIMLAGSQTQFDCLRELNFLPAKQRTLQP